MAWVMYIHFYLAFIPLQEKKTLFFFLLFLNTNNNFIDLHIFEQKSENNY